MNLNKLCGFKVRQRLHEHLEVDETAHFEHDSQVMEKCYTCPGVDSSCEDYIPLEHIAEFNHVMGVGR